MKPNPTRTKWSRSRWRLRRRRLAVLAPPPSTTLRHRLVRTNREGPGVRYKGECVMCGKRELSYKNLREVCPGVRPLVTWVQL